MMKLAVDVRLKDDTMTALRRSLCEARESQADAEGYRRGKEEGIEEGREMGFSEAVEMMLKVLLDFKNGNRTEW